MFHDVATITLSAGKGGNGVIAWRREKYIPKGGPYGGNGGKGGDIYIQTDSQLYSLDFLRNRRLIKAEDGKSGGSNHQQGKQGKDFILRVPCGTLILDADTEECLLDACEDKQQWLLCRGGKGGKGNSAFKSPTHQAPNYCTEGLPGETKNIRIELKLIADIGLIGMPNAGKSTLFEKLTTRFAKTGAYPFTTLFPNLSFLSLPEGSRLLIADIPGIIADAHRDKGLGLQFLKHIERTQLLLFVIDISGEEGRDPLEDFSILQKELQAYREDLLQKPFLIVLNKIDKEGALEKVALFHKTFSHFEDKIMEVSALEGVGVQELTHHLTNHFLSFCKKEVS
jgi:GTPase